MATDRVVIEVKEFCETVMGVPFVGSRCAILVRKEGGAVDHGAPEDGMVTTHLRRNTHLNSHLRRSGARLRLASNLLESVRSIAPSRLNRLRSRALLLHAGIRTEEVT
jgi:hypothetical protein